MGAKITFCTELGDGDVHKNAKYSVLVELGHTTGTSVSSIC